MQAFASSDPGVPHKRFTVTGNEGEHYGAFDTTEEVLATVKSKPNGACTIRFGAGVDWDGQEADELLTRIAEL